MILAHSVKKKRRKKKEKKVNQGPTLGPCRICLLNSHQLGPEPEHMPVATVLLIPLLHEAH